MNFFEDPAPILTETGTIYVSPEEAADLHGLGLIMWDEAGNWRSRITGVELTTALEGL
jgi:hypothetical protein